MAQVADGQADPDWESALDRVRCSAGTRGLLLLAAALCRRVWELFPHDDCRRAVVAVERLADHPEVDSEDYSVADEVDAAMEQLQCGYARVGDADVGPRLAYLAAAACGGMWHDPTGLIGDVARAAAVAVAGDTEGPAWEAERRAQVVLFNRFAGPLPRPSAPEAEVAQTPNQALHLTGGA